MDQTIHITTEYNKRDISENEQIVEEDEQDKDDEDQEPGDKIRRKMTKQRKKKKKEENPWVGIRDEVEGPQKEKLKALIAEIQKSGESEEVADVEDRKELRIVQLKDLK